MTQEDCEELNLFSFSTKKDNYIVDDVSDDIGWKEVKKNLIRNLGGNSIPKIEVDSIDPGRILVLHHDHDGRDLQIQHAEQVVEHTKHLWGSEVKLITMVDDAPFEI